MGRIPDLQNVPTIGAERKFRDLESSVVVAYANFVMSRYRNEVPAGTRVAYEYVVPEGLNFDAVRNRIAPLVAWLHRPGGGFARSMRLLESRQKRMFRIQAEEKEPVRDELEAVILADPEPPPPTPPQTSTADEINPQTGDQGS